VKREAPSWRRRIRLLASFLRRCGLVFVYQPELKSESMDICLRGQGIQGEARVTSEMAHGAVVDDDY